MDPRVVAAANDEYVPFQGNLQRQRQNYIDKLYNAITGTKVTINNPHDEESRHPGRYIPESQKKRVGAQLQELENAMLMARQSSASRTISTLDRSYYSDLAHVRKIIPATRGSIKQVVFGD